MCYFLNLKLKYIAFLFLCFAIQIILYFDISKFAIKIPVLLWWTPLFPNGDRIISCDNVKCLVTNKKNNDLINVYAILFYGSHIDNTDFPLPRNNDIPWAIIHEESPKNYAPFLFEEIQYLFNVTSTFSQKSDFPITLQYLSNMLLNQIKDKKHYVPVRIKNNHLKTISPVLYIQSDCDTPSDRDYFVKELSKYVEIDSYGRCLQNKTFPKEFQNIDSLDLYNEDFLNFIAKYKFIIAFENAICEDYITEKLWRPFIVGSIPIYLGSPTIEQWLPNKNSAILVKEFKDMSVLGKLVNEINKNDTWYDSYLEHKIHSKISNQRLYNEVLEDHSILSFECFICKTVYQQKRFKSKHRQNVYECPKPLLTKRNSWNQHWDIGRCQAIALKYLIKQNVPYSKEEFEKIWKDFCYYT